MTLSNVNVPAAESGRAVLACLLPVDEMHDREAEGVVGNTFDTRKVGDTRLTQGPGRDRNWGYFLHCLDCRFCSLSYGFPFQYIYYGATHSRERRGGQHIAGKEKGTEEMGETRGTGCM